MNELALIENYFTGKLSPADKAAFERKVEDDMAFAEAVSFYMLSRQSAQEILIEEKKREFLDQYQELTRKSTAPATGLQRWWPYGIAAAASLLIFVAYIAFFQRENPQQLADAYIDQHFTSLSTTMNGAADSLALGIGAFNEKDYREAELIFHALQTNEDLAPETTEYLGILYLTTERYEQAIDQFNKLISFTDLFANPGKFYLAITLMKRSKGDDDERAKHLLQEVVAGKLPGHTEASVWLEQL